MTDAADRAAIVELVARYNRSIDGGDVEAWVGCFTDDGVFDGLPGRFEGADALRAFATDFTSGERWRRFRGSRHWCDNFVIDVEGDRASLVCDHLLVGPGERGERGPQILLMATYDDRLRCVGGEWRFEQRRVNVLSSSV